MKSIFISLFVLLFSAQTFAQGDQVTATVEGLGCAFCANGLEKKFKDVKGIKEFSISLETGVMTFRVPASAKISQEEVAKRVAGAGYTLTALTIERANGGTEEMAGTETPVQAAAAAERASFAVKGSCGMCKDRIEKAARSVKGVLTANWNEETHILTVEFNPERANQTAIENAVAKSGHDTDTAKAPDAVYKSLPGCCMYER